MSHKILAVRISSGRASLYVVLSSRLFAKEMFELLFFFLFNSKRLIKQASECYGVEEIKTKIKKQRPR